MFSMVKPMVVALLVAAMVVAITGLGVELGVCQWKIICILLTV